MFYMSSSKDEGVSLKENWCATKGGGERQGLSHSPLLLHYHLAVYLALLNICKMRELDQMAQELELCLQTRHFSLFPSMKYGHTSFLTVIHLYSGREFYYFNLLSQNNWITSSHSEIGQIPLG